VRNREAEPVQINVPSLAYTIHILDGRRVDGFLIKEDSMDWEAILLSGYLECQMEDCRRVFASAKGDDDVVADVVEIPHPFQCGGQRIYVRKLLLTSLRDIHPTLGIYMAFASL
jgi:hypothetical protein